MVRRCLLGILLSAGPVHGVVAQDAPPIFPSRPISMVVGFAPGGPADVIARLIAPTLAADLGQPVAVENASGAGGSIGQARVAAARPDGHTILFGSLAQAIIPTLYRHLSFDPTALQAIGMVNEVPMSIIARRDFPAATLADLVAVIRRDGRGLNLGNAGVGSTSHLCSLLLVSAVGTPVTIVPYRGNGPMMNDLLGGRLDLSCDQTTNNSEQIRAGAIRGYAITGVARTAALPEVPTTAEAGLPLVTMTGWNMLFAPTGTPGPVVERLNRALRAVLADATVPRRMLELGSTPASGERTTPDGAQAAWRTETARWRPLLEAAGQYAD
ncbi:tripartite tricarboxylate transporter substrate binding protein BugD [Roseomonas nepalensis]|uniref:Tripartite tricarboxylate transporter substrate binding protein BugD n=1 Tax=Muricoccus nepalensis TaxID=1854500 RepID=A0A502GD20_9PROT|nr:tripartite tricarboxylate transporter substrate-binding protein [Roseomonas nepalensis]TPG58613.1 tripartite tricarboxylate transporter substrate binding protein BugD [Roseomonas nepalensis]